MSENNKIKIISAKKLQQTMNENPQVKVINVLDNKYYNDCHIKNSINISYDKLLMIVSSWDKDQEIIVYCATLNCAKSIKAYELLEELGFKSIAQYPGGMQEWFQKGYPIQGACLAEYLHRK